MHDGHIVCVLDDDAECAAVRAAFGDGRYDIETAHTRGDLIADTSGEPPADLLLMRARQPDADGDFIRKIREQHASDRLPIVFLVNEGEESLIEHCLACGGDDFLTVPIHGAE